MFSALDVSTSALVAQRQRLDVIASNLANLSTTRDEQGVARAYRPRHVTFATDPELETAGGGQGVRVGGVEESDAPPNLRYQPGHPDADPQGYVAYPSTDMTTEFVDALAATRAYEANIGVIEVTKEMVRQSLQIVA